eukprot:5320290-Prymnesium_polylepis.1
MWCTVTARRARGRFTDPRARTHQGARQEAARAGLQGCYVVAAAAADQGLLPAQCGQGGGLKGGSGAAERAAQRAQE